jgi:hypothetical protein
VTDLHSILHRNLMGLLPAFEPRPTFLNESYANAAGIGSWACLAE